MRLVKLILTVGGLIVTAMAQAVAEPTTEFQHKQATALAFDDKAEQAVAILRKILDRDPNNYPVYRDFVVYTAWAGRCADAVRLYQPIKDHKNQEPFLITTVADCVAERNKPAAIAMLERWGDRYPDNQEIRDSLKEERETLALQMMPTLDAEFGANNSDIPANQGQAQSGKDSVEFVYTVRYTHPVLYNLSIYGRYRQIDARDPEAPADDLERAGVGVVWAVTNRWSLTQDFSQSLRDRDTVGKAGSTTILSYLPHPLWETSLEYATYSEDVPLRALAINTTTDRLTFSWYFHSPAYRHEWLASLSANTFDTDGATSNERRGISSEYSYGFEMGRREQRIGIEAAAADNKSDDPINIPYYNPDKDFSASLVYKLHYTYHSRFSKHVDHVTAFAGNYAVTTYSFNPVSCNTSVYGLGFESEYGLGNKTSFRFGGSFASHAYDCGPHEDQFEAHIAVSRLLW